MIEVSKNRPNFVHFGLSETYHFYMFYKFDSKLTHRFDSKWLVTWYFQAVELQNNET